MQTMKTTRDDQKNIKCDQCECQVTKSNYSRKYMITKHEHMQYKCDQCDYQSKGQQYLKIIRPAIHPKIINPPTKPPIIYPIMITI